MTRTRLGAHPQRPTPSQCFGVVVRATINGAYERDRLGFIHDAAGLPSAWTFEAPLDLGFRSAAIIAPHRSTIGSWNVPALRTVMEQIPPSQICAE